MKLFLLVSLFLFETAYCFPRPNKTFSEFTKRSPNEPPTMGITELTQYLANYGYMSKSQKADAEAGGLQDPSSYEVSIKKMQYMYGLEPTGRLDEKTRAMMAMPRCGVEDVVGTSYAINSGTEHYSKFSNRKRMRKKKRGRKNKGKEGSSRGGRRGSGAVSVRVEDRGEGGEDGEDGGRAHRRTKRYNLEGNTWDKLDLSYQIENYTPDMSRREVDDSMASALKLWSDETNLSFRKVNQGSKADIHIKFGAGHHGDSYPFDGRSGTLAHAFFPKSGETHFDEDEQFDYEDGRGVNLMIVAAHEFGHTLGLAHSNVPDSLMAPVYQGYVPNFKLPRDDVMAIQQLYGRKKRPTETTTTPRPRTTTAQPPGPKSKKSAVDVCKASANFDASYYDDHSQELVAFRGNYFWRFDSEGKFNGYPKSISSHWRGLTGDVDAVAYSSQTSRIYFFKGKQIWRYHNGQLERGFPRPLSDLALPNRVDAAMKLENDGLIYVFRGRRYYRFHEYQPYDGRVRYRKLSIHHHWNGIPDRLDGALTWNDGSIYFFRRNKLYKFSKSELRVEKGFPKKLKKYFIKCSKNSVPVKYRTSKQRRVN